MNLAGRRRATARSVVLDRSLESLPFFRLSDSAEEAAIAYTPESGGQWRVLPALGERLPGTFDQDVYVEIFRRFAEAGFPENGTIAFTLHAFLRSMGRRVDGRTYEQLRSALGRLERTRLESIRTYYQVTSQSYPEEGFTVLTKVAIDRRRLAERDQLVLFPMVKASEPGDAHVTISPFIRANIMAGHTITLSAQRYAGLSNPVARRLYRLLEVAREGGALTWRVGLD